MTDNRHRSHGNEQAAESRLSQEQHHVDGLELTAVWSEASDSAAGADRSLAGRAGRFGYAVATALVIVVAVAFIYEIIARFLFNSPSGFVNQLSAYALPVIGFLGAAGTLAHNGHVAVDVLVQKLSPKAQAGLAIVTEAFSVLLLLVVTVITVGVVMEFWESGYKEFSTSVTFPEYLPQIAMPVGLALLTMQQMRQFVGSIRRYGAYFK